MSIAEKLTTIAENVQKVYEAGKSAGGDSYYDEFWDSVQSNGNKIDYRHAFYGPSWTESTFKPKYNMTVTNASSMFYSAKIRGDFSQILKSLGVILDLSACSSHGSMFNSADRITHLGEISLKFGSFSWTFGGMTNLIQLKLIVNESGNQSISHAFDSCGNLEDLEIVGKIGYNGLNLQWSTKLSKASITSVINALSETTSGLSITLSKEAVNNAFGIDVEDDTTYPEGSEYYTLRHSKDNWTINYI